MQQCVVKVLAFFTAFPLCLRMCLCVYTRAYCRRSCEKRKTHAQPLSPCWWTSKRCRTSWTYLRARGTAFTRKSENAAWTLLWACPQAQTPALGAPASLRYPTFPALIRFSPLHPSSPVASVFVWLTGCRNTWKLLLCLIPNCLSVRLWDCFCFCLDSCDLFTCFVWLTLGCFLCNLYQAVIELSFKKKIQELSLLMDGIHYMT